MPDRPPHEGGSHLTREELRVGLEGGLNEEARRRLVLQFATFSEVSAEVLRTTTVRACGSIRDPVQATLWRLREGQGASGRDLAGFVPWAKLYPHHRLAVASALRSKPLGFCRLILEEARALALEEPARAFFWAKKALSAVEYDELAAHGRSSFEELKALGRGYLADAHRIAGRRFEASEAHRAAANLLGREQGDPEIVATLLELRSTMAWDARNYTLALNLLVQAEGLLDTTELADRQTHVLISKSDILGELGESGQAREILRRALSRLRSGEYPRLRLRALHNLAAEEIRAGNFDDALKLLEGGVSLYTEVGEDKVRAQRHWLLGLIYLETDCFDEAKEALATALDGHVRLGLHSDTVRIVLLLGRLHVLTGHRESLRKLEARLRPLVRRSGLEDLLLPELKDLRRLASERGLATDELSELIAELEESR